MLKGEEKFWKLAWTACCMGVLEEDHEIIMMLEDLWGKGWVSTPGIGGGGGLESTG